MEVEVRLKEVGESVSKLATEFCWALNSALDTTISRATPSSVPGDLRQGSVCIVVFLLTS